MPSLGHLPVAKLRSADIQGFVADLRSDVRPGTKRSVFGVHGVVGTSTVSAPSVSVFRN
jgi:hypothetical protein